MEVVLNQRPRTKQVRRAVLHSMLALLLLGIGIVLVVHGRVVGYGLIVASPLVLWNLSENPTLVQRGNTLHWGKEQLQLREITAVYQGPGKVATLVTPTAIFQPPVNFMSPGEFDAFLRSMHAHAMRNLPERPIVHAQYSWHPAWDWGGRAMLLGFAVAAIFIAPYFAPLLLYAISGALVLGIILQATGTGPMRLAEDGLHYKSAIGKERFVSYGDILARKTVGVAHRLGEPLPLGPSRPQTAALELVTSSGTIRLRPRISLTVTIPQNIALAGFSHHLGRCIQHHHETAALGSK